MSSEPKLLRELQKEKPSHKWYVYYDVDTGDIVTVTNKEKDFIHHPHLITDSDDARQMLMGFVDPKKYAIVDINGELKLVEKSAVIRIKEAENKLSIVPISKTQADVNIFLYNNQWKMEVNFSQDTLYRMTGKRFFRNVSVNPESGAYDPINLYLIKNNDPNFLIKTITIDPAELIDEGYLIYDLTPLRRLCNLTEISIMTRKIFSSYRLQRRVNFTGVEYTTRYTKRRNFCVPTPVNNDIACDFTIKQIDDKQFIKSNFNNPQDEKIYKDIGIYLTEPRNPNRLVGMLNLPLKEIGWQETIEINTDIDLLTCGFLCKDGANLTFDYATTEQSQ